MTQLSSAPGSPWVLASDHFFCVQKDSAQTSRLATMLSEAASSLASGAHLIALPVPPPIIYSISPATGSRTTTTHVTLTGKYFTDVYAISSAATNLSVVSDTTIKADLPPVAAVGPVTISVTNPSGPRNTVTFTYTP